MKSQLSGLDIRFLVGEIQGWIGARIVKIFQKEKLFVFEMYQSGKGGALLTCALPRWVYVAQEKDDFSLIPPLCQWLRKHIQGGKILAIKQPGLERIIEIAVSTKEDRFVLVVEAFGTGNLFVLDNKRTIVALMTNHEFKDRVLKKGESYIYPPIAPNPLEFDLEKVKSMLAASNRPSISQTLAQDFGLGGSWATEVSVRAGFDPKQKTADPIKLLSALKSLNDLSLDPFLVFEDESPIDVTPIPFQNYKDAPTRKLVSFSEGIAVLRKLNSIPRKGAVDKKIESVKVILDKQEESLLGLRGIMLENTRKGELIYENYQGVQGVLDALKEARKTLTWHDIKKKLKNPKIISLDETKGELVIDL